MPVDLELQWLLRSGARGEDPPSSGARADESRGREPLWAQIDREITNKALWVPLFNGYRVDLVSNRVGNDQYNPQTGALLSQLWVR